MRATLTAVCLALSIGAGCRWQPQSREPARQPEKPYVQTEDLNRLEGMIRRFAPVDLTADVSSLPKNERDALAILVNASKMLDALFLRQVWE